MSRARGLRAGGVIAGFLVGLVALGGTAHARVSIEQPGSIVIFPKVINLGGLQDTEIQLTNTRNVLTHARCFYVNGASVRGVPIWQVTDFEIWLTRQQPTHWQASIGRRLDPTDEITGLDPGSIPPVPPGFTGELTCVEVDGSGSPMGGNSLKGEATVGLINGTGAAVVSKYNAVAIPAEPPIVAAGAITGPDGDNILMLDNLEYSGCPLGAHFNFVADGAPDDVIDGLGNGPSATFTNLVFVPCSEDFERLIPSSVSLSFDARDEFETRVSGTTSVTCWAQISLGDIADGSFSFFGPPGMVFPTEFGYALIESTDDSAGTPEGVLAVANVLRMDGFGNAATAATNLHFFRNGDADGSEIRLSDENAN